MSCLVRAAGYLRNALHLRDLCGTLLKQAKSHAKFFGTVQEKFINFGFASGHAGGYF